MAIEFTCQACGHVLKLRDEAAGKRGRCPSCGGAVSVPATPTSASTPPVASAAPAGPAPSVPTPSPAPQTKACPDCGNPLPLMAVICVKCGLNLKTGKKLQTVFEPPEGPAEEEPPPPSAKPQA